MSATRLMVLGLLSWLQPVHGYDIRRELLSWNVEHWANIQPGSIYHALRKLTDEGLLEAVGTEQVGARPARTVYRLTPAGVAEFESLLRKYWWEFEQPVDPFQVAVAFLPALPREEAVAALRARARLLEEANAAFREQGHTWLDDKPPHVSWQIELTVVRAEAEARWCRDVAARVEAGEGFHTVPGAESWDAGQWRAAIRAEFGDPVDDEEGDTVAT